VFWKVQLASIPEYVITANDVGCGTKMTKGEANWCGPSLGVGVRSVTAAEGTPVSKNVILGFQPHDPFTTANKATVSGSRTLIADASTQS
jgi:hypothetical protein